MLPPCALVIPLGDIDLQREIQLDRRSGVASLRRLHTARVEGKASDVTVAVYQGAGAKQQWRRDIARYRAVRHPNIVQLYGMASYGNIHAAVFHDDLIPFQQFSDLYKHPHFTSVYIQAYIRMEFKKVYDYSGPSFGIICMMMTAHFSPVAQLADSVWTSYPAAGTFSEIFHTVQCPPSADLTSWPERTRTALSSSG
ncbi:hypothetical protein C8R45DRAFT_525170 [Mycena sanguinolenta]|nr:hypothetical protein C8R45DRAFT_525170 [Mycena sanguinolenta]